MNVQDFRNEIENLGEPAAFECTEGVKESNG